MWESLEKQRRRFRGMLNIGEEKCGILRFI